MTPQEFDARVEQIAKDGGSVNDIVSFLTGSGLNIPLDKATKVAGQWVEFYKAKVLPPLDRRKLYHQEIARLNELFLQLSNEIYDRSIISTTMEDWANCNTLLLMEFWKEEYESMQYPTGTKVQSVEPENCVPGSGSAAYGEVIVNHFRFLLEQNSYQEDYMPVHTEEQKARLKGLGDLHAVQWYSREGRKVFITFCRDDQIVKIPES